MRSLVVLLVVGAVVVSFVAAQNPPMGPPRLPKDLPPGFAEVLPKATVQQLRAIHANAALTPDQQHAQIDKIMSSLPNEVLDRLPQPPFFDKLPKATRDQLKAIHRDRTLTWRQRHEKIHAVLESLPPNLRPHPPPHPPSGGEPTDIDIPEQALREVEDFGVGPEGSVALPHSSNLELSRFRWSILICTFAVVLVNN